MLRVGFARIKASGSLHLVNNRPKVITGELSCNTVDPLKKEMVIAATQLITQHCAVRTVFCPHSGAAQSTNKLAIRIQNLEASGLSECSPDQIAGSTAVIKDQAGSTTNLNELEDVDRVLRGLLPDNLGGAS